MGRLAVIATAYGPRGLDNLPRMKAALAAQTRPPDEVWWMTEGDGFSDLARPATADDPTFAVHVDLPTPRNEDGTYAVVPYSLKQNYALDRTECDYVTYLTDDSWPAPEKYERMVAFLDEHPEAGAAYCTQDYGGLLRVADFGIEDAHCKVDHTQVVHRLTADRWPEDIEHLTLGDAVFWRRLHASLGMFDPMGADVLDYVQQTGDGISAGERA